MARSVHNHIILFMVSEQSNILMWNCRGYVSKAFLHVSRSYLRDCKLDNLIIVKTRVDLEKLRNKLKKLGFDSYDFTDNKGYVGGIAMG